MSSLDDDNHASVHNTHKFRRIVHAEVHDHLSEEITEAPTELNVSSSHHSPKPPTPGDDSDDDSFGEASDSCEPDHEFMEQSIEDYHPERLNLLDQTVPESVYKKKPKTTKASAPASASISTEAAIQETKPQEVGETAPRSPVKPSSAKGSGTSAGAEVNQADGENEEHAEDSGSNGEEHGDRFSSSPQRKPTRLGFQRTKLLGTMGKSTKKSLRTINGTFWSKPFKGLAKSLRGTSDKKEPTD